MLLGPSAVGGNVGVLGGLEIRPPPVGDHLMYLPLCADLGGLGRVSELSSIEI